MGTHTTRITPLYPAYHRAYDARCDCGWRSDRTYPTRAAATDATNTHTTLAHPSTSSDPAER